METVTSNSFLKSYFSKILFFDFHMAVNTIMVIFEMVHAGSKLFESLNQ